MEKAKHKAVSASALPALARHEKALIDKENEARREAKSIVDRARAEAFAIQEEAARSLAAELAAIRREGEEARERERERHAQEFQRKLAAMREDAQKRARVAIDAVVALVLPKGVRR